MGGGGQSDRRETKYVLGEFYYDWLMNVYALRCLHEGFFFISSSFYYYSGAVGGLTLTTDFCSSFVLLWFIELLLLLLQQFNRSIFLSLLLLWAIKLPKSFIQFSKCQNVMINVCRRLNLLFHFINSELCGSTTLCRWCVVCVCHRSSTF